MTALLSTGSGSQRQPGAGSSQRPGRALFLSALMGMQIMMPWQAAYAVPPVEPTKIADQPVASLSGVPANVLLALSVEFPTAVSQAFLGAYATTRVYRGYFNERKCYVYQAAGEYFKPDSAAAAGACNQGGASVQWSGNFLNWATMQTIDTFRLALTGGHRDVDSATETMLEKAIASGQGGYGNFGIKEIVGPGLVKSSTQFGSADRLRIRVKGLGSYIYATTAPATFSGGTQTDALFTAPDSVNGSATPPVGVTKFRLRVKVCEATDTDRELNCTLYPSGGYKPTGLMQENEAQMRFGVFGYLADEATGATTGADPLPNPNLLRGGGVMRARLKSIGPKLPTVQGGLDNTASEWDATTGQLRLNPDASDALASAVAGSGAVNYINRFGLVARKYKTYDPISELYYESLRYLQGRQAPAPGYTTLGGTVAQNNQYKDGFPVISSWDDPVQYACQKNFILGIGDVNTHADKNLPGSASFRYESTLRHTDTGNVVNVSQELERIRQSEGGSFDAVFANAMGSQPPAATAENGGQKIYASPSIAGLAAFASRVDQRPTFAGDQTVRTYWVDVLEFQNYKHKNQFWLAAKYGGFDERDLIAGPNLNEEWRAKGRNFSFNGTDYPIPDNYFVANDPNSVINGLREAFRDINERVTSSSGVGLASPNFGDNNAAFAVAYDSSRWSGTLSAYDLQIGADGVVVRSPKWEAGAILDARMSGNAGINTRTIATARPDPLTGGVVGIPFQADRLSGSQLLALGPDSGSQVKVLGFLRGLRVDEGVSGGLRVRKSVLGDIVNSEPVAVDKATGRYSDAFNPGFGSFAQSQNLRPKTVYVGANDGMLHAFDGALAGAGAGAERWAYVPSFVLAGPHNEPADSGLRALADPIYQHRAYVDSTPVVRDVDFANTFGATGAADWRTILVGGLGKGGRGYYALDVTSPHTIGSETALASKLLWEFTDPDMGYTAGKARIFKTRQHGWVVALMSGYNNIKGSKPGEGFIYILNAKTGALIQKIGTGAGTATQPSGLAHAMAYVPSLADYTSDSIYAGDLLGNLWRFDLRANSGLFPAPSLIAQLRDDGGRLQPVTTEPDVSADPATKVRHVFVGTGRSLHPDDRLTTQQSFYAMTDGSRDAMADAPPQPLSRSELARLLTPLDGVIPTTGQRGWYFDLSTSANGFSERVDTHPSANGGTVAWGGNIPSADPCAAMTGRVYVVKYGTGQTVLQTSASDTAPLIFMAVPQAITKVQRILVDGKSRTLVSTAGDPVTTTEKGASGAVNRLNWREVVGR